MMEEDKPNEVTNLRGAEHLVIIDKETKEILVDQKDKLFLPEKFRDL